jgi:hypothetical protein
MPRAFIASIAFVGGIPNVKLNADAPLARAAESCSANGIYCAVEIAEDVGAGKPSSA